jgi:type I restriction enzyme, R subunit
VQQHIGAVMESAPPEFITLDQAAITAIKEQKKGGAVRVINLLKSIQKAAEEDSGDPFLIALADRAAAVRDSFEDRQTTTAGALDELLRAIEQNLDRKRRQAEHGLDDLTRFVLTRLQEAGIGHPELVSKNVSLRFADYPNWRRSEFELRELRKKVTFAIFAEEDDMDKVAAVVERLFDVLQRTYRP